MDPVTATSIAASLLRAIGPFVASRLGEAVLGRKEERALRRIVGESVAVAVEQFPVVAGASAEIDLLSESGVAEEVLAATVPGPAPTWQRARERWGRLYGTEMPPDADAFLQALAREMRPRLQRSQLLQGLWTARAVESQAGLLREQSQQLTELIQSVDGLGDPLTAIERKTGEIGGDLGYAISVANALGAALASGTAGKHIDLRLRGESGDVEILGKPGADVQVHVTKLVPNTDEGRKQLQAIDSALQAGQPVDMGDVNVAMTVGGVPVTLPSTTARLEVGRATRSLKVLVTAATPGVDEVAVLFTGESYREDHTLHFTASESNYGPIRVELTVDFDSKHTTARFYVDEQGPYSLQQQIVMQRILAVFERGGSITVDFIDPPLTRGSAAIAPDQAYAGMADALQPLSRLRELASLLHLDLPAVDSISGQDHALIAWAIDLVHQGQAKVAANGSFSLRGDAHMADQLLREADDRGRFSIRYELQSYRLDLSGGASIELGPLQHTIRGALLEGPTEAESGVFEATITYTAQNEQLMTRLTQEKQQAAQGRDEAQAP